MFILVGCATNPQPQTSSINEAAPLNSSKLIFKRVNSFQYNLLSARVYIDGKKVAELKGGDSYISYVKPGSVVISTDMWGWSGEYKLTTSVLEGKEYTFEISPRDGSLTSALALGGLGNMIFTNINENKGPLAIKFIDASSSK
jgi:hypothetical protein